MEVEFEINLSNNLINTKQVLRKIFDIGKSGNNSILSELNERQKEAILSETKRLLVLAGAGSGKTKTLIQKILYLIYEKNVDPSQILAITFTKNAANEIIDRLIILSEREGEYYKILNDKNLSYTQKNFERLKYIQKYPWLSNLTIKTFHGLSHNILRNYGAKEFDNKFSILTDNSYNEDFVNYQSANETPEEIIDKLILSKCEDPEYLLRLKRYILDYYVDNYRKKMHKLGKANYQNPYTTLKGENVRSKSERDIADWLYRHRISYHYEPIISPGSFEFRPDFFIDEANLYLELVSDLSYPLKDKEKEMINAGKVYVKIQENETHNSNKFNKRMDEIVFSRIDSSLKKISPLEITEEFKGYEEYRKRFVTDTISVIDKIKVEDKNLDEIYQNAINDEHFRVKDFYKFFKPLFYDYQEYCISRSYLDFNDLLIRNVSLFENEKEIKALFQNKYRHILVDEFQDVNSLQVKLLQQLLQKKTQLFCVGDDWQSIYGFRGSDVEYIINFKKYFENSQIIKLDINYRSNSTIVDASNEVIKNNKYKIDKKIRSLNQSGKKIYLYCAEKEREDGVKVVLENINKILQSGHTKKDILVLTRTRKSDTFDNYYKLLKKIGVRITTIHQAKGLEAKFVFIIGLTQGFRGFPYVRDSDRIFQMIKKSNIELMMEEERRLFYVALTRAKEELFLISEVGNESEFIKEIPGKFLDRNNFLILNISNTKEFKCNNCSMEITESYHYCPYCGNQFNSENIVNSSNENHSIYSKAHNKEKLEKIMEIYPNAYKKWEKEEENRLISLFKEGKSFNEISQILHRQPSAIRSRLNKLGFLDNQNH